MATKKTETKAKTKAKAKTEKTETKPKTRRGNPDNLNPVRSKEEASERGRKGGIASGQARRNKKALKECFDALLDKRYKGKDGKVITGSETLALAVFQKAQRGDLKAFEIVRDTAGQKPIEKVMLAEVDQDTIDQVESMVLGGNDANSEAGC